MIRGGWYAGPEQQGSEKAMLWETLRASPESFWDNRQDKRNPRAPDFRHKDSGDALWLDSRDRPPWIDISGNIVG